MALYCSISVAAVRLVLRFPKYGDADLHIVGNDVRKAIADGFPVQNVIASDLRAGKFGNTMSRSRTKIQINGNTHPKLHDHRILGSRL